METSKKRILVLDDEPSILDVLTQHLRAQGYVCEATTSPSQALEMLQTRPFALFLTDLKMPEMNGIEMVQRAKTIDERVAIVVVTALVDVTSAIQALRAGADDYVLKPFNLGEITLAVSRAMEKRDLILENRRYQEELEERVREATQDLEHVNRELRSTRDYLESLLHSTVDAIMTLDTAGKVEFANHGASVMFGYSKEEFTALTSRDLFAGGAGEALYIQRKVQEGQPLQNYETELRHKQGMTIPVNMSLSVVRHPETKKPALLAICKDITAQKRLEQELKEMSIKDSLTGLFNQRYFHDRLKAEMDRAHRQKHPLSLLLLDIDQFKTYNDCHGHLAGDKVLQTTGEVILESTRVHVDLGFRYGGDEFTVILPEADDSQALAIAERIRRSFEAKRFDHLTLSIGLMPYREGYSLRTFIQFTDAMMYDAKRSGGNQVFMFRPEEHTPVPLGEDEEEDAWQRDDSDPSAPQAFENPTRIPPKPSP
ncbi:MAG TPA: diguanylate cyclase [Candidatus Hydrogenedentes bacterium]|nr:diguanylate cyclase [Candidatus Hydrogenedentota bacterium]